MNNEIGEGMEESGHFLIVLSWHLPAKTDNVHKEP
jgi:hypothetical protein